jgi:hypothetical protein
LDADYEMFLTQVPVIKYGMFNGDPLTQLDPFRQCAIDFFIQSTATMGPCASIGCNMAKSKADSVFILSKMAPSDCVIKITHKYLKSVQFKVCGYSIIILIMLAKNKTIVI